MDRLESRFDRSTVKRIRMNCQCGYGMGMDEKYQRGPRYLPDENHSPRLHLEIRTHSFKCHRAAFLNAALISIKMDWLF